MELPGTEIQTWQPTLLEFGHSQIGSMNLKGLLPCSALSGTSEPVTASRQCLRFPPGSTDEKMPSLSQILCLFQPFSCVCDPFLTSYNSKGSAFLALIRWKSVSLKDLYQRAQISRAKYPTQSRVLTSNEKKTGSWSLQGLDPGILLWRSLLS
jgi:hypothetical protein